MEWLKSFDQNMKTVKVMDLDDRFTFGQYECMSLRDVLDFDADYVKYLIGKKIIEVTQKVLDHHITQYPFSEGLI
jgi:hypothetical protein